MALSRTKDSAAQAQLKLNFINNINKLNDNKTPELSVAKLFSNLTFDDTYFKILISHLAKMTWLTSLDMSDCQLDVDIDFTNALKVIIKLPHLHYLDLSGIALTDQQIDLLNTALQPSAGGFPLAHSLLTLNLSRCQLKGIQVKKFTFLETNIRLTHLDLSDNAIDDIGVRHIARCLKHNPSPASVLSKTKTLEELATWQRKKADNQLNSTIFTILLTNNPHIKGTQLLIDIDAALIINAAELKQKQAPSYSSKKSHVKPAGSATSSRYAFKQTEAQTTSESAISLTRSNKSPELANPRENSDASTPARFSKHGLKLTGIGSGIGLSGGVILAISLLAVGILASNPVGWMIAAAIGLGCLCAGTIGGAVIGRVTEKKPSNMVSDSLGAGTHVDGSYATFPPSFIEKQKNRPIILDSDDDVIAVEASDAENDSGEDANPDHWVDSLYLGRNSYY